MILKKILSTSASLYGPRDGGFMVQVHPVGLAAGVQKLKTAYVFVKGNSIRVDELLKQSGYGTSFDTLAQDQNILLKTETVTFTDKDSCRVYATAHSVKGVANHQSEDSEV